MQNKNSTYDPVLAKRRKGFFFGMYIFYMFGLLILLVVKHRVANTETKFKNVVSPNLWK